MTLTKGTLTVNRVAFSYTVGNDTQIYGTAANLGGDLPAVIATGVNGEKLAIGYSSSGDTTSAHVGTYDITAAVADNTGKASDYNVSLTNGKLTVDPYSITYQLAADGQIYGTAKNLASDQAAASLAGGNSQSFAIAFSNTGSGSSSGATISTGVNGQNLAIVFSSTGDTPTADVGSYDITGAVADGTGKASDYSVTLSKGTLTVTPFAFTFQFADTQTYGLAANLAADLPATIATGVNSQNLAISSFSSAGNTSTADIGSYDISGSIADGTGKAADYIVTLKGTLTVKPYALNFQIGNDSQTYGTAANLATDLPTTTIATGVNGQNLLIAYSSAGDTATAHVGSYDITGSVFDGTGKAQDYAVAFTNGILKVNPYAFRYTIGNDSQTYGTAANLTADLPATISTGVNSQNLAIAYSSAGDSTTAHVGSYDITGSLADNSGMTRDYAVTLTNGTLTIMTKAASVTPNAAGKTYGETDPVLTWDLERFPDVGRRDGEL